MNHADAIALARDCVLLVALGVALYTDLTRGKVYNGCTLPAIALGLLISYVAGATQSAQGSASAGVLAGPLLDSVYGLALALGIFGLAHLLGMLGGGDVKLMCAVGAIAGWEFFLLAAFLVACIGAILAVGVLIWRGRLREGLQGSALALFAPRRFKRRRREKPDAAEMTTIPYVPAIVIGTVAAWILTL